MPMRGELLVCAAGRRRGKSQAGQIWAWAVATSNNPEFQMVALFCAIGLWLTFYFMHHFQDFGAAVNLLEPIP